AVIGVGIHSLGGGGRSGDALHHIAVQNRVVFAQGDGDDGVLGVVAVVALEDLVVVVVIVIVSAERVVIDVHQVDAHGRAPVLVGGGQVGDDFVHPGIGVRTDDDGLGIAAVVLKDLQDVALAGQHVVVHILIVALLRAVEVHGGVIQDVV